MQVNGAEPLTDREGSSPQAAVYSMISNIFFKYAYRCVSTVNRLLTISVCHTGWPRSTALRRENGSCDA